MKSKVWFFHPHLFVKIDLTEKYLTEKLMRFDEIKLIRKMPKCSYEELIEPKIDLT